METIALIIMLLMGNADFAKGKTVELDMSEESENMVLAYQNDGWVNVTIKEENQPAWPYIDVLIEEKSLTFRMGGQSHKMSRDDFLTMFEVKALDDGTGYDYVTKIIRVTNGQQEEIRNPAEMRFKKGEITVTSQGKTQTFTILKNPEKPDAGESK